MCPACGTETVDAPGIGPFCPNPDCDRLDDLRPIEEYEAGPAFTIVIPPTPADQIRDLTARVKVLERENAQLKFLSSEKQS